MEYTKNLMNCLKCHHRNPENGNCVAVGGFCTAVPAAYCPLIPELLARCTRLEEARERANDACAKWEARAERAERALARMWYAYANKDPECPHEYEQNAVREAERILGKWEDVMPGMMRE